MTSSVARNKSGAPGARPSALQPATPAASAPGGTISAPSSAHATSPRSGTGACSPTRGIPAAEPVYRFTFLIQETQELAARVRKFKSVPDGSTDWWGLDLERGFRRLRNYGKGLVKIARSHLEELLGDLNVQPGTAVTIEAQMVFRRRLRSASSDAFLAAGWSPDPKSRGRWREQSAVRKLPWGGPTGKVAGRPENVGPRFLSLLQNFNELAPPHSFVSQILATK